MSIVIRPSAIPLINKDFEKSLEASRAKLANLRLKENLLSVGQVLTVATFIIFATCWHSLFHIPIGTYFCLSLMGLASNFLILSHLKRKITEQVRHRTLFQENLVFHMKGTYPIKTLSSIEEIWKKIELSLKYLFRSISFPKTNVFSKVKDVIVIALSENCGKKDDLNKFIQPQVDPSLSETAKKDGIIVSPTFETDPFGRGVCHGSSLYFANRYFASKDINATAKEFTNGAPFEAVCLQGKFGNIYDSGIVLVQESYKHADLFAHTSIHVSGLSVLNTENNLDHKSALKHLNDVKEGVYEISVPVYNQSIRTRFRRQFVGRHALLMIKEKETTTLFDPNHGTGQIAQSKMQDLTKAFFEHYGVDKMSDDYVSVTKLGPASEAT